MIHIEKGMYKDLGIIVAEEIATQEYPLGINDVKPYVMEKDKEACLARIMSRTVGYALVTFDKTKSCAILNSIGVNPKFRRAGVGTNLLNHVLKIANAEDLKSVLIYAPTYTIEDEKDPWNVKKWLKKNKFKAVGTSPGCCRYGRYFEWYIFERLTSAKQNSQSCHS